MDAGRVMDLTDEAYSTLNLLQHTSFLDDDLDIEAVCKELVKYFNFGSTLCGLCHKDNRVEEGRYGELV
jgi:hypothetical protein